jgi:hypothetical protein
MSARKKHSQHDTRTSAKSTVNARNETTDANASTPTPPATAPRAKRRFRRTRRALFVLVVLALVVRFSLTTVITSVATSWAADQGLDLEIEELDLALLSGRVHVWGLTVSKDGERALAIESIDLDVEMRALFDGAVVVRRFEVDGVDARLERAEDGRLTLLDGFAPSAAPTEVEDHEVTEHVPLESLELPIAILGARVQRVHVEWTDRAVVPNVDMVADLDLSISDLGVSGETARARLRFEAPGAFDRIALDATLASAREFLRANVSLDFTGLEGDRVTAYLDAAGLEAPDRGQDLRLEANAALVLKGPDRLEGAVELVQSLGTPAGVGTSSWLELARVTAHFAPDDRGTRIDVDATGLRLAADRAVDGRLVVAGFTLGAASDDAVDEGSAATDDADPADSTASNTNSTPDASATDDAAASGAPTADSSAPASPIRLATAKLVDARIALTDRAVGAGTAGPEPVQLVLEITELGADLDGADGATELSATLGAPGVFGAARIEGSFAATGGRASVSIDAITLERLRPYLAAADMEPTGASTGLELSVQFESASGSTTARVTELALVDGPRTPLTAARIEFSEKNGVIDAAVVGLVVRATSEAPGRTAFGPLRMGRVPVVAQEAGDTGDEGAAANGATEPDATATPGADASFRPEPIVVELDARVAGFDTSGNGGTGTLSLEIRAPGLVDRMSVEGEISEPDKDLRVDATLAVEGLRERALGALRPDPEEAARGLSAQLALRMQPDRAGGERLEARIDALDLDGQLAAESIVLEGLLGGPADQNGGRPVLTGTLRASGLAAPEFELESGSLGLEIAVAKVDGADHVDVANLVVEDGRTSLHIANVALVAHSEANGTFVETAHVLGVEVDAIRREDGALEVAGLTLVPPTTPAGTSSNATTGTTGRGVAPAATEVATAPTRRRESPRLALGSLIVDVARLEILDEANGTTTRARLHLENAEPSVLFDPQGEEEPLALKLEAALEPGIGSLVLDLLATPDEAGLALALGLRVEGLDAAGWVQAWPPLGDTLAPEGVENGRLALDVTARLDAPRTDATGFDLRRMSNAVVEVRDLAFHPTPDAEGPRFELALARTQIRSLGSPTAPLRLGEVELSGAVLDVEQRADGLAIAGLVLRTPAPVETSKDTANVSPPAGQVPAAGAAGNAANTSTSGGTAPSSPAPTGGGLTIDHFQWTGLDLSYTDLTATPVVRLPLEDFEVDVRQLAIGTPARRPLQFRAGLRGGAVDLPEPRTEGSFLGNLTRELTGNAKEQRSERRWIDELLVSGRILPGSSPDGWVRAEVFGFELMAIQGLAAGGGVDIGAGTVDTNVRIDLRGARGQRVKSRTTFTSLSVSEPANGPISRFLRLPAPLDTVLWVLRNERGEQVIPLTFTIDESGVSTTELVSQGTQALVRLITDALASSPLRLGGGLLDFVGLDPFGSSDETPNVGPPIELEFDVGDTRLTAAAQAQVTEILRALGKDDALVYRVGHRFVPGDIERARALAIPDVEESRALARRLEVERDETVLQLAFERERLARLVATGAREEAAALTAALRKAAARLDGVENSLDTLYELSIPADERTRAKRVAAAAQRLAERRFEALVRELFARGAGDDLARLQFARPRLEDMVGGEAGAEDVADTDGEPQHAMLVFTPQVR